MILVVLAYLGGVLTIASPCILPVLPFVFARGDRPVPLLTGMIASFALVASLAAVGGSWAIAANEYGRDAAMALLALFGLALLFPALSDRLTQPLVRLGERLSHSAEGKAGFLSTLLLGVATGLLWTPCAGPILGLILTGAALGGANAGTTALLVAYGAGAATSLGLALLAGKRIFTAMKGMLGAGEWVRRGLGVAVLVAVAAIALGFDTGFLTEISLARTTELEQDLINRLSPRTSSVMATDNSAMMAANPAMMMMKSDHAPPAEQALDVEGTLPSLSGATEWLNSPPLTAEALKGKVVVVDFWTYSCINCLRAIPYVRAWAEKYKDHGLVVIGVHAPEFAFEKLVPNVKKAVADLHIAYPVAIDNDYAIWRAFNNQYWPAHYFIDAEGRIRHHHFGEGDYEESEQIIRQLLKEAGQSDLPEGAVAVAATGAEAPPDMNDVGSPETYVGYQRAENFISPGGAVHDAQHLYEPGASPRLNEWALSGEWTVGAEDAALDGKDGAIAYRFHARDLHLVLGPGTDGKPVRFRVTIDGAAPGDAHGVDIDAQGNGTVTEQRLYQLVRQKGPVADRDFRIEFLDPGVKAYAFTFG